VPRRADSVTAPPGLEQIDTSFGRVMRDTGASMGLVYLLTPGERVLRLAVVAGTSRQIIAPWVRVAVDTKVPVTDAIRERRLVLIGNQEEMARRYPRLGFVLPYDFMLAAAPITVGATVWGGLVLQWPVWHPPQLSPSEHDAVVAFCRHADLLLQRAAASNHPVVPTDEPRLLPPPRPRNPGRARAVAAVAFAERLPVGCCSLDLEGRVTFVNTAAAALLGADVALLGASPWEVLPWLRDPVFEDRYRAAVFSRRPTSFTVQRAPDQRLCFELYPDDSGISIHITPLPTEQATTTAPGQHPPPSAEPVGAATLYHLMHLAAALAEAVGAKDVVGLVADQAAPAFGAQGVALLTAEDGRLRIMGYRGYSAEFMSHYDGAPLTSPTPTAHALTSGVPRFFTTSADFERAYPEAVRYGNREAWVFLPLIASGRPVGSLVLSYDQPRSFPSAERAILTSLAGLIAQALDRARLYDTKHQLAHTLQIGLLPHALPHIPGLKVVARYLPASRGLDIGGDFYDLIRRDEAAAAAVIGDVQGHNITAATLMGQLRTAVHAHAASDVSPGEVLARTNRLLIDFDSELFASCLYAHLDLSGHRIHLATAGHPPPLLRLPNGHTEVPHLHSGLLLGVDQAAHYPTTEIPLPPGAVLALYTDGLVESPGIDIDDAIADLADCLTRAQSQTLDTLADTLIHHSSQAAPRNDDVALLLIRATP
jgi:GAF domain-containing protein